MRKEMFITVGTSLYFSATWENLPPASDVPGYEQWLQAPRRTKPKERKGSHQGKKVEGKIISQLAADPQNVATWSVILPQELKDGKHDPKENLRFSAELSSLLMLADHEKISARDLLSRYEAIHVVVDPNETTSGSSYVAGVHLLSYLQTIAGPGVASRINLFKIPDLASVDEALLVPALQALVHGVLRRSREQQAQVDLLASGGYKIYVGFLSHLVAVDNHLQLLYLHEEASKLVRVREGRIAIGNLIPRPMVEADLGARS